MNQEAHDLTSLHQVKGAEHVAQCSHIQHKIEKDAALNISQMATYWFVIGWFDIQKAQKGEV